MWYKHIILLAIGVEVGYLLQDYENYTIILLKTVSWNVPPSREVTKCCSNWCYLKLWAALNLALIWSLFTGTQNISFINCMVFGCVPKMATHFANNLTCDIFGRSCLLYLFPQNIFNQFTIGNCLTYSSCIKQLSYLVI